MKNLFTAHLNHKKELHDCSFKEFYIDFMFVSTSYFSSRQTQVRKNSQFTETKEKNKEEMQINSSFSAVFHQSEKEIECFLLLTV